MANWHAIPPDVATVILASRHAGLTGAEVRSRRARFGANELPERRRRSGIAVVAHQFRSPLIYLLLVAAGLALALGESGDAIVIAVVVAVNAVIGAIQEGRAEHALAALRQLAARKSTVVRDGQELVVDARELVPGDVHVVTPGDAVTADARLIEAAVV